jgi:ABC-type transport system involved in multi-copper enzyme maturation permease subunit
MPLGPVFNAELLTTARRPRYYVVRFLYGLVILTQVYLSYQSNTWRFGDGSRQLSIRDMADFGENLFTAFAVLQAVTVILLTPALVGGAIADEKQRKTLHYLLTSRLSSFEIVLGKLAARLLQVLVLVALGLPVVSLIGLFGGVDFQILLISYAATLTTIYFLSTASILVSTVSRRPREAISLLYLLEMFWLLVPPLLLIFMPFWGGPWTTIASWVNPVLDYVAVTSPLYLSSPMGLRGAGGMAGAALRGMGMQVAFGTAFVLLAMLRLRPAFRNDGGTPVWARGIARLGRKRSWFPRPECGDDPMLWKEMYVARTGGLAKAALVTMGVGLVGIIGYAALGFLVPAVEELWEDGYSARGPGRRDLNVFLRGVGTAIYILWSLGIASSSAGGLSGEREEDQWTSLITTPLSGKEIIRAKMIGPVWGLRLVAYLLFLLWGVGVVVGAIHPFGLLACLVEFAVFTWFLTALGNYFSLRSKNSTRSLASTMALLVFLNGGYLFCLLPFQRDTAVVLAGSTPFIFTVSLLSVEDFNGLSIDNQATEFVAACFMGVAIYGVAAAALTLSLFTSFDRIVDRPDRRRRPASQQREFLKSFHGKEIQPGNELT